MTRTSQRIKVALGIFVLTFLSLGVSPKPAASQQDRAKACNDLADKKGLKGQERASYLKDCNNAKSLDDMNQRDKLDACQKLADKRNLKGADRRSFIKDCMNRANSK